MPRLHFYDLGHAPHGFARRGRQQVLRSRCEPEEDREERCFGSMGSREHKQESIAPAQATAFLRPAEMA